ncbi:MAG: hypothetical protein KDC26_10165 [Armatimonadetes bacterium]|nr:hypothetical protein [Armatimonadota bacterium]
MKSVRLAVSVIGLLLMAGGYFASQSAYWGGNTEAYIKGLDSSPLPVLALVLLLTVLVLAFLPDKEAKE